MHYRRLARCYTPILLVTWRGSLALTPRFVPTCPRELRGASAFSMCWAITDGLLELISTGVLISTMWRPGGEWTILLRVFKAVVMENCPGPFLLDPGPLRRVGVLVALPLEDEDTRDMLFVRDDWRPLFFSRRCLAVRFGWKDKRSDEKLSLLDLIWASKSYIVWSQLRCHHLSRLFLVSFHLLSICSNYFAISIDSYNSIRVLLVYSS